jgi:hypothetical protein
MSALGPEWVAAAGRKYITGMSESDIHSGLQII